MIGVLGARLIVINVAIWCRANGAHKRHLLGSDLLRLERRLARSIAVTCPGSSTFLPLVVRPDDRRNCLPFTCFFGEPGTGDFASGCRGECAGWDGGEAWRDGGCGRWTIPGRFHLPSGCASARHCCGVGDSILAGWKTFWA